MSPTLSRVITSSAAAIAAAGSLIAISTQSAGAAITEEYAALGDSFASGNGTRNPDINLGCYRSSEAYGPEIAAERASTTLVFPACGGAVTDDVINTQSKSLTAETDWVTVSIGGNDVGFAELLLNCGGSLDEPLCLAKADEVNQRIDTDLGPKLDTAYASIKQGAPNAGVISIGYPRFFGSDISCLDADGITPNEATALNGLADNLEAKVADRSRAAGIQHINPIQQFAGHDICSSTPYLNGKAELNAADAYHPSPEGYSNGFKPLIRKIMG
ncbi:MAG: SGNH/GDSL hydrolase family protein [Nocardioides sp.]|uniref:SGNH/GDSL hydrolase family protein n=1 Tax=Nocardioides sp. TaxID=35761 RepID=UPI003D6A4CB5